MSRKTRRRQNFRNEYRKAYFALKENDSVRLDGAKLLEISARCLVGVSDIIGECIGTKYEFMDEQEFRDKLTRNRGAGIRIYWREILFRAHFAAAGSLIRTQYLVEGMKRAWSAGDVYGFVNSFRFLIESSADSKYSLSWVPITLANSLNLIANQLSGRATDMVVNRELEDHLIHFMMARKLEKLEKESLPSSHEAKRTFEYLNSLNDDNVKSVYAQLCQIGHPAGQSLAPFFMPLEQNGGTGVFTDWMPGKFLENVFDDEAQRAFEFSLMMGTNYSHCIFTVLNALPEKRIHVPAADRFRQTSKGYAELQGILEKQKTMEKLSGAKNSQPKMLRTGFRQH